jgi:phosphate:Na+ symporter
VVQSSSATVAITITLARNELIGFDTAVALVLGENIGTTITAYLASLGATTSARRVAYGHILIKVIGVSAMICLFPLYLQFLKQIVSIDLDIAKKIAVAHTVFNVLLVVCFLPLVTPFVMLLQKLVPEKPDREEPRLTFLDLRMLDTPAISIQQSSNEILRMGDEVIDMLGKLKQCVDQPDNVRDRHREQEIFEKEKMLDVMQKEIMEFLGDLLTGTIAHDIMDEARQQLRIADEYESISDYITTILKLRLKGLNSNLPLTNEDKRDILALHDQTTDYVHLVNLAVKQGTPDILPKAMSMGEAITYTMKEARQSHIRRVEEKLAPPLACLIMVDMLQSYRRIKDHTLNIAETLAGEK